MKFSDTKIKQKGMTIVELLVVLTIVFIVSAFAIMQIDNPKESLKMKKVSTEFKVYLERARFDSVKRNSSDVNQMAKVRINSATSFSAFNDFNLDGVLDTNEKRDLNFSHQDQIKFFSDNLVFPVMVSFNNRGHTSAVDGNGNSITPTFLICQNDCEDMVVKPENYQIVSVTPTGTVTILNGDELLNTPQTPTGITTDTSSDINPFASTQKIDGSIPILDIIK